MEQTALSDGTSLSRLWLGTVTFGSWGNADVDECIDWCEANLVEAGKFALFCQAAWEAVHACVGTLDCTEFTDWCDRNPPFDYPCLSEDLNLEFECKGQ